VKPSVLPGSTSVSPYLLTGGQAPYPPEGAGKVSTREYSVFIMGPEGALQADTDPLMLGFGGS
jgi:hypothetical protein